MGGEQTEVEQALSIDGDGVLGGTQTRAQPMAGPAGVNVAYDAEVAAHLAQRRGEEAARPHPEAEQAALGYLTRLLAQARAGWR